MAASRSDKYKYQWPDGTWHSVPKAATSAKGVVRPATLPPPPVGTYDPGIDYNAQASQRGYGYAANDAQTAFEQGQQDYGLGLGDLTTSRDRNLADLATRKADVQRQYGILGHQQDQAARQRGVTSAGLLALSDEKRLANQAHDIAPIDLATTRTNEDFTRGKLGLDLANARQFGGFNGQTILNPITGQPEAGSLLTSLTRQGAENTAFQGYSGTLRAQQAAENGYVPPSNYAANAATFQKKKKKPSGSSLLPPHFTGPGWW